MKLIKNKLFILTITTFLCICLLCGTTFCWFSKDTSVINSFANQDVFVNVVGSSATSVSLSPGQSVTNEVRLVNMGKTGVFVRVSLSEYLMLMDVDLSIGNLATTGTLTALADPDDTGTWAAGKQITAWQMDQSKTRIPLTDGSGSQLYFTSANFYTDQSISYLDSDRADAFKNYYSLTFGNVGTASTDDWIYTDGYFYYSKELLPGKSTAPLLRSYSMTQSMPNTYKGALYKITASADFVPAQTAFLNGCWELPTTSTVYQVLYDTVN